MKNSEGTAILLFDDCTLIKGKAIGAIGTAVGEICFNTGMTGYQEIFTDPSYAGQIVTLSNVHVGNYGIKNSESQSSKVQIEGLIVKNYSEFYSRTQADLSIQEFLLQNGVIGISDVDTRMIVRHIRKAGAMNVVIDSTMKEIQQLKDILKQAPNMAGNNLAGNIGTENAYFFGNENSKFKVAILDFGVKQNILICLANAGLYLKIFPGNTTFQELNEWNPDGYFISNGPGDPSSMHNEIEVVNQIFKTKLPMFGICLGHQLMALASGLTTQKIKYGHRGLNHGVLNLLKNKSEITSQNHGFEVVQDKSKIALNDHLKITHRNLNDGSIEGLKWLQQPAISVQYHPESSPGPFDSRYLFEEFYELLTKN